MLRPTALLALVLAAAPAALAAPTVKPADITGAWTFQTDQYGQEPCTLSGQMIIRPAGKAYSCTFTAHEICNGVDIRAEESCTATRAGDALSIVAKVHKVTPAVGYQPDDFRLTIKSANQMHGQMLSFRDAPVRFFRGEAPIS